MEKEKKKAFKRRIGYYALRSFTFLNAKLPLWFSYFLGWLMGSFAYLTIPKQSKISVENLAIAFPNMSLKKRKKITRDFFIFMAQGSLELLYFLKHPDMVKNIRIEGKEHLDAALAKGKGVVLVTAHLGNFPLMSLKLLDAGNQVSFVARPMRDEKAGDYIQTLRANSGVKTIFSYPRRECVTGIIKTLRDNEIVILQMDQNFGTGGVWVNFFGKLAATPVGPIVFATRTNAAIVPAYIYRESKGKHCIKIFPEHELIKKEDKDEATLVNAIALTKVIEQWVRDVPTQWGWIHRRWKSRPSEKVLKEKFKVEKNC